MLNGIPHFAISVGYEQNGEIKCGIIFDPIKDEMFFAEKGLGAFLNNTRIRVSKQKKLTSSKIKMSKQRVLPFLLIRQVYESSLFKQNS